ncbi:uncharacterized protein LOC107795830 [Nicotiana tabacum]|uniref:Uncharacterized protein LOC107795830 n=1 Tax=Nicotiana tabacum TaxID=4097 RepID=A0A1S4ABW1_TOBAC|nr:uncharacterized protein LOC104086895 [Nicotiana tomentosiformis]XP_016474023.1 PREDICTED: uncharacterized protein LOC107795830 [Nicotiana tabacum]
MMSVERSFEAWEEVQRHGQDLADKLAQGVTGLIQSHISPPSFSWPDPQSSKLFDVELISQSFIPRDFGIAVDNTAISGVSAIFDIGNRLGQATKLFDVELPSQNFIPRDFGIGVDNSAITGVSSIFDIGNRIGQAGADFGACLNGMVQQFVRKLPVPFRQDEKLGVSMMAGTDSHRADLGITLQEDLGSLAERFRGYGNAEKDSADDRPGEEEFFGVNLKAFKNFGRSQGTINVSSTYESRTRNVESSVVARGDLWRVEASQGSSTSGNENSSLFLVQLGPVLFVRDSTLLLPVHLSKQHLLWYGYDRKRGMHSLCPAVWSKHRRWLLMSMICLNPLACSFMDLQFPNGQITYVAGEGVSTSAFLPLCGGLLQAQGQYPGELKFSFSCKNEYGTCIMPMMHLPDKSFSFGVTQALAWKRSGLMYRPTIQLSVCPTFGGSSPGLQAEITHSLKEELSVICGCTVARHSSAYASLALGRSKWNGNVGSSGLVFKVETPLGNTGRSSFSVQLNSGIEF